jgi:hypothetical protein
MQADARLSFTSECSRSLSIGTNGGGVPMGPVTLSPSMSGVSLDPAPQMPLGPGAFEEAGSHAADAAGATDTPLPLESRRDADGQCSSALAALAGPVDSAREREAGSELASAPAEAQANAAAPPQQAVTVASGGAPAPPAPDGKPPSQDGSSAAIGADTADPLLRLCFNAQLLAYSSDPALLDRSTEILMIMLECACALLCVHSTEAWHQKVHSSSGKRTSIIHIVCHMFLFMT